MPSHDEAMPCWDGWAWLGGVRRGYKSDPNTEGAPTLRDRPATRAPLSATHPPKLNPNISTKRSDNKGMQR